MTDIYVMRCAIWYQTLKKDVRMVDQNAVLTKSEKRFSQSVCMAFKPLFDI